MKANLLNDTVKSVTPPEPILAGRGHRRRPSSRTGPYYLFSVASEPPCASRLRTVCEPVISSADGWLDDHRHQLLFNNNAAGYDESLIAVDLVTDKVYIYQSKLALCRPPHRPTLKFRELSIASGSIRPPDAVTTKAAYKRANNGGR